MELLGIEKYISPRPVVRGLIKHRAEDFKVTEELSSSVWEPAAKRVRTIPHESLSPAEEAKLTETVRPFGTESAELIKLDEKVDSRQVSLGMVDVSKRRHLHGIVTEQWPWLQTRTVNDEVFAMVNSRSFIPLMRVSSFDIASMVHRVSIAGLQSVNIRDKMFDEKSNRKRFMTVILQYFKKLLQWTDLTNEGGDHRGYRISMRPKPDEATFLLAKVERIGIAQAEVVSIMAKKFKIKDNDIAYAGTKDSKAQIIQHFSIKNCSKETVLNANFGTPPRFRILSAEKSHRHLQLGELESNKFEITIHVAEDDADATPKLTCPMNGFYNYFGLQRFGVKHNRIINNSLIENIAYLRTAMPVNGILIMMGYFRQAAVNSLSPSVDGDDGTNSTLRDIVQMINIGPMSKSHVQKHIKKLHPGRKLELALLRSLASQEEDGPTDWSAVWRAVPFRTKQFAVQSGGSLLWNRAAGLRDGEKEEYLTFLGIADEAMFHTYRSMMQDVLSRMNFVDEAQKCTNLLRTDIESNLKQIGLDLSCVSGRRKVLVTPKNVSFESDTNTVSFSLPSGSYATMCLREWSHGGIVG